MTQAATTLFRAKEPLTMMQLSFAKILRGAGRSRAARHVSDCRWAAAFRLVPALVGASEYLWREEGVGS